MSDTKIKVSSIKEIVMKNIFIVCVILFSMIGCEQKKRAI